jgi:hypothetical protein
LLKLILRALGRDHNGEQIGKEWLKLMENKLQVRYIIGFRR